MKKILLLSLAVIVLCWGFAYAGAPKATGQQNAPSTTTPVVQGDPGQRVEIPPIKSDAEVKAEAEAEKQARQAAAHQAAPEAKSAPRPTQAVVSKNGDTPDAASKLKFQENKQKADQQQQMLKLQDARQKEERQAQKELLIQQKLENVQKHIQHDEQIRQDDLKKQEDLQKEEQLKQQEEPQIQGTSDAEVQLKKEVPPELMMTKPAGFEPAQYISTANGNVRAPGLGEILPGITDILMSTGFENGGARPAGWTDSPGASPWTYGNGSDYGPGNTHGGSYAAYFDIFSISRGVIDTLISPVVDLSTHSGNYLLTFWYWDGTDPNGYHDSVEVIISENGVNRYLASLPQNLGSWTQLIYNFTSTSTSAKIKFVGYSDYGWTNPYIDDFTLLDTPPVGRCCYGDPLAPSCANNSISACAALSGAWDPTSTCATACPAVVQGENCLAPFVIDALPYNDVQNTANWQNDYGHSGKDVVYELTLGQRTLLNISTCNTAVAFDDYIYVWGPGQCGTSNYLASMDGGCTNYSLAVISNLLLPAGTYYILVEAYGSTNGTYTLDVDGTEVPLEFDGETCDNPIQVNIPDDLSYQNQNTTCGMRNDYTNTCLGSYDSGEDIIYQLNVSQDGCYNFTLDPGTTASTGMAIDDACPLDPSPCIASHTSSTAAPYSIRASLTAGNTYYIIIDTYSSTTCIDNFALSIDYCPPPQNGEECEHPIAVSLPAESPYTYSGTTRSFFDNYNNTCLGTYDDGEDIIFELNVTTENYYDFSLDPGLSTGSGIALMNACPNLTTTCIAYHTNYNASVHGLRHILLTPGLYYLMIDSSPTYNTFLPSFTVTMNVTPPPPQGDNCADPIVITSFPYTDSKNTADYFNDYSHTGNDVVYRFTVDQRSVVDIQTCNTSVSFDTWLGLWAPDSCGMPTFLASADGGCVSNYALSHIPNFVVGQGTYYILVESYFSGTDGTYTLDVNVTPAPLTTPGEACGLPIDVSLTPSAIPYTDANTTCGMWNDYSNTCLGYYDEGEDAIYRITVSESRCYVFTLDPGTTDYNGMVLDDQCPPASTGCVASATIGYTVSPYGFRADLTSGTEYYLMIDSETDPGCIPAYTLTIDTCPPPQPGEDCGFPIVVNLPAEAPYTNVNTTCGMVDDYENTCLGFYDGGEDIIYQINVAADSCYNFTLDPGADEWTGIALGATCPLDASNCIATSTELDAAPHGFNATLAAGTYYLMIDTWPDPTCISNFTLTIGECPPPLQNDNCADAIAIGNVDNLPFSTNGASHDGTDPFITSPNIWYLYTAPATGQASINLCGSRYDTRLTVYDGSTCDPLPTVLGQNDDGCANWTSSTLTLPVVQGSQYLIEVGGYLSNTGDGFLTTWVGEPPANDNCDAAVAIGNVTDLPFTTMGATFDGEGTYITSPNVWYVYTASCTGTAMFNLCGSTFDTKLAVYDGASCSPIGTTLGTDDDGCADSTFGASRIFLPVVSGNQYLVEIGGSTNTTTGSGLLTTSCNVAPANDNCSNVTPVTLVDQVPNVFTGDNTWGSMDCVLNDDADVWFAFTLDSCFNVTISGCGTDPWLNWVNTWLYPSCPCAEDYIVQTSVNWDECGDGNWTLHYDRLPAGTYYYPLIADPEFNPTGPYTVTITGLVCPPPQPGENCDVAIPVTLPASIPYTDNNGTCGMFDDYNSTCLGLYDGGEDIVYAITVTQDGCFNFTLDPQGTTYSGIALDYGCPLDGAVCIASHTESSSAVHGFNASLTAGTYYLMIDTWPAPDCIPAFTLTVDTCIPAAPGVDCTNPLVINLPAQAPYTELNTTCGMADDYANTCLGLYDGGEDIVYQINVATDGCYNFVLDPEATTWTGIALDAACPLDPSTCIAYHTSVTAAVHGLYAVQLTAGTYYLMIDTYPEPDCIPEFSLSIEACPPPAENDNCANATMIGDVTDLPFSTIQATFDGPGTWITSPNIWYLYNPTCTGLATVSLCGSSFDTRVVVYNGVTCDPLPDTLGRNDNSCSTQSSVTVPVFLGTEYLIEVGGATSTTTGNGLITVSCAPPPQADFIVTAPGTWIQGNTCGAGDDCSLRPSEDQLWAITIPNDGTWKFSLCNTSPAWDSYISLGRIGCTADLGHADQGCVNGNLSEFSADLTPGLYYLDVEGYVDLNCGAYVLDVVRTGPPIGTIHGTAFQADGVTPLPQVRVITHNASEAVVDDQVANASGIWNVVLPPGTYHEHITKTSFTPAVINNIVVTDGGVTNVSVNMSAGGVCTYVVGDDNGSGTWTGQDVTYGVRFFKGGNPPLFRCECPTGSGHEWYVAGDVNGSCSFTGQDVTRMVLHFKSGVVGIPCPDCPPTTSILIMPGTEPGTTAGSTERIDR